MFPSNFVEEVRPGAPSAAATPTPAANIYSLEPTSNAAAPELNGNPALPGRPPVLRAGWRPGPNPSGPRDINALSLSDGEERTRAARRKDPVPAAASKGLPTKEAASIPPVSESGVFGGARSLLGEAPPAGASDSGAPSSSLLISVLGFSEAGQQVSLSGRGAQGRRPRAAPEAR